MHCSKIQHSCEHQLTGTSPGFVAGPLVPEEELLAHRDGPKL